MLPRALALLVVVGLPVWAAAEGLYWENWDQRQVCRPANFFRPSSEADLVDAVAYAHGYGLAVKVVGAGHSFSPIALTNGTRGVMLSLDALDRILAVEGTTVTIQAGIRLHALNAELEKRGLALENLGATCEQSLAGAVATGTHGTGRLLGSMSTQILGLRVVLANGTVVETSASENPEIFAAARVGLGALGVISALTLRTLPLYTLRLNHTTLPLAELFDRLPALNARYERLQWYWQPPDEERATLVTREVVDAPVTTGCWDAVRGEPATLFDAAPAPAADDSCVDVSYKALCGSAAHYAARKLYTEMEMFLPTDSVMAVVDAWRAFFRRTAPPAGADLLVGVRYVAADDITLSPQHGRDNAVISIINTGTTAKTGDYATFSTYARQLEFLAAAYVGRPHWGKMNYASALDIEAVYGRSFYEFRALRDRLDPKGLFLNDYLRSRLGY